MESKTGYSENNLPYFRLGESSRTLVVFEGLNFENKPPSGLQLRFMAGDYKEFAKMYTIYSVGRKPNLPQGYSTQDMANDYAEQAKCNQCVFCSSKEDININESFQAMAKWLIYYASLDEEK